ncbi:hypothetical protein ACT691_02180 [Vibrio metschnikovii]
MVGPGQEVVNTSFESDSWLLKLATNNRTAHNADPHLSLPTNKKPVRFLAAYWYKFDYDQNWNPLPDGQEMMPQWGLGTAKVNTYAANYYYQPDHPWLNLHANVWYTGCGSSLNITGFEAVGTNAEQYFHGYSNDRSGFSVSNESLLTDWPVRLTSAVCAAARALIA